MCQQYSSPSQPPRPARPPQAVSAAGASLGEGHDDAEPFPWDLPVLDAHCHPTTTAASMASIPSMSARALAVMATRQQDQDLVLRAAEEQGIRNREELVSLPGKEEKEAGAMARKVIPAFGHHPWFSQLVYDDSLPLERRTFDPAAAEAGDQAGQVARHLEAVLRPSPRGDADFLAAMPAPQPLSAVVLSARDRLLAHPAALVGEVGLDKAFRLPQPRGPGPDGEVDPPADDEVDLTPGGRYGRLLSRYRVQMAHQEVVLKAQLALAAELGRPVSVHGVQCPGVLFDALASCWRGHEREVLSRRQRALVAKGAEKFECWDSEEERDGEDEEDEEDEEDGKERGKGKGIGSGTEKGSGAAGGCSRETVGQSSNSSSRSSNGQPSRDNPTVAPYPPRICLHSFSGSPETLKQYLDPRIPPRIFFSFSAAVNLGTEDSERKLPEVVRACPDDRLLIESDLHTAGDEMDAALERMYRWVCRVKGWGLREGVERIARNYEEFVFGPE